MGRNEEDEIIWIGAQYRENEIAGLLADHVDRGDDEETGGKKGDRLLFWRASNVEKLVL
jgi:hypothetical protein